MQEGEAKLAPMPFIVFCVTYPGECAASTSTEPAKIALDARQMEQLQSVNRHVNASIEPREDTTAMRLWHLDARSGDCNEFAIQKRHELIKAGLPASALMLTVAKTSWGEGHLLLTVHTDHGDFILDSLTDRIVSWDRAPYRWIMRQSLTDPMNWVAIGAPAEPAPTLVSEQTKPEETEPAHPRAEFHSWRPPHGVPASAYEIGL